MPPLSAVASALARAPAVATTSAMLTAPGPARVGQRKTDRTHRERERRQCSTGGVQEARRPRRVLGAQRLDGGAGERPRRAADPQLREAAEPATSQQQDERRHGGDDHEHDDEHRRTVPTGQSAAQG